MKLLRTFLMGALLSLGLASVAAAQSCPAQRPSGNVNRAISATPVDQALFSALVLYHTNVERCRRGMRPLQTTPGILRAAIVLAEGMAEDRNYSHVLNQPGVRNLADRMHFAGETFRRGGENIALNFYYALNGRSFTGGGCNFRYQSTGQPVPAHSYASLAEELVASWMASAGHRANILNRRYNRMGAAVGLDPRGQLCGQVYAAQTFAG